MEDKAITEYKMFIKICDREECVKYDPLILCYVNDCMACPNARVKIIREDGVVMRNDFKFKKNICHENRIQKYKRLLERDCIELFEEMYNIKFTKFQKWYLKFIFRKFKLIDRFKKETRVLIGDNYEIV